jgi:hypothetical protein
MAQACQQHVPKPEPKPGKEGAIAAERSETRAAMCSVEERARDDGSITWQ